MSRPISWSYIAYFAFITGVLAAVPSLEAAQITTNWLGGPGTWSTPGKWNNGVPNNGGNSFNALIDNANPTSSTVTLDMSPTIDNLTISAGDSLVVSNSQQLKVISGPGAGTITNAGTITINSTGNHTYLVPLNGPVTLTGGGIFQLSDSSTNWMYSGGGGASFVNVDNTIQGAGNLGWSGSPTPITNQGLVIANGTNPLVVDSGSATFTNTGTLRATGGATLQLQNGCSNAGGLIEALTGSTVQMNGSSIQGGTLSTSGTGLVSVVSTTSILDGSTNTITNAGLIRVNNNARLTLRGTVNNTGTININSTVNNTYLHPNDGPVTLTGGGVVQLSDSSANWVYYSGTGASLVNVDNTIQGAGNLGWSGAPTPITNQGLVIANGTNPLVVDSGSATFTNAGTLRATGGATLQLQNGCSNAGGLIEALTGSTVLLNGSSTISGGTLSTSGTGLCSVVGTASVLDGSTDTITNSGSIRINNNGRLTLRGTVQNTGTININSTGNDTYLHPNNGPVMLTGGGIVQLSDKSTNWIFYSGSGASLVNVNNTIQGAGHLGWSGAAMAINNQGTILANGANALTLDCGGGVVNSGNIQATGAGGLQMTSGSFTTSGNIIVSSGSSLSRTGGYVQTAGTTTVNGTMSATGGLDIQGGILGGSGTITGTINNGGSVQPGTSPGILSITGNYTQTSAGELAVEIGGVTVGTQYDRFAVSGVANLNGTLRVSLINAFVPNIGDSFTVMTYASYNGAFATYNVPCNIPGISLQVDVGATALRVIAAAPVADINCDCVINLEDADALALALVDPTAFGATYPGCSITRADLNGDGFVNGKDVSNFIHTFAP